MEGVANVPERRGVASLLCQDGHGHRSLVVVVIALSGGCNGSRAVAAAPPPGLTASAASAASVAVPVAASAFVDPADVTAVAHKAVDGAHLIFGRRGL